MPPEKPTTPKKPPRLMIPLPAPLADLLRETASITGNTQAELIMFVSTSRQLESAVTQVLRGVYMERLRQGERLFASTKESP